MKTIKLFEEEVELSNGKKIIMSRKDLIQGALDNTPREGFTVSEMKERARIDSALCEAIEKKADLQLEDADFDKLKQLINDQTFVIRHKFIIDFVDEVNGL